MVNHIFSILSNYVIVAWAIGMILNLTMLFVFEYALSLIYTQWKIRCKDLLPIILLVWGGPILTIGITRMVGKKIRYHQHIKELGDLGYK